MSPLKTSRPRAGWTCPKCARVFGHRDQPHSCHASNVAAAAGRVRPELRGILDRLLALADRLDGARIESASGSFMVKAPATFASFRPRVKDVQVSFILDEEVNEFPVNKTLRLSTHRVAHRLHVDAIEDIDAQLIGWLKRAHALSVARPQRPGRKA